MIANVKEINNKNKTILQITHKQVYYTGCKNCVKTLSYPTFYYIAIKKASLSTLGFSC